MHPPRCNLPTLPDDSSQMFLPRSPIPDNKKTLFGVSCNGQTSSLGHVYYQIKLEPIRRKIGDCKRIGEGVHIGLWCRLCDGLEKETNAWKQKQCLSEGNEITRLGNPSTSPMWPHWNGQELQRTQPRLRKAHEKRGRITSINLHKWSC